MKVLKKLLHLSGLACSMGLLAVGTAHAQISDDVVRIGIMADQSGVYSGNGGPGSTLAARMAIEDFGGKVLGKPIEVVVADDQNKPNVGINIARQWIENDKVDAILGGSASSIALGIQQLMKEKKKPYLLGGTMSADLTGKSCSPMTIQFICDTYSLTKGSILSLLKQGYKSFFFITVDYAFGKAYQDDATRAIEAGGGKVIGSVKHPLGATDYSSYLMQAKASGAQVIGILNAGMDLSNALKQANEYRLAKGGQTIAIMGLTINTVPAMGQEVAAGLQTVTPFYWDRNEETRAWSKRFMARNNGLPPTFLMAGAYTAMLHYLKAVQAAGTDDGPTVVAKMKATPLNDFSVKNVQIREDGQAMRPMYMIQIKSPAESKDKYDLYSIKGELPAEQVQRPLADGGCDFVKK